MNEEFLGAFSKKMLGDFFLLLICPRKSRFVNFLKGIYVLCSQSLSINVHLFTMYLRGGGNTTVFGVSAKNKGIAVSGLRINIINLT